jgi:apolipoprotein N-acyltransferase
MNRDRIEWVLALALGLMIAYVFFNWGKAVGIRETRAKIIASEIENYAAWDRETYDKAVAEEVERQKEMNRGR